MTAQPPQEKPDDVDANANNYIPIVLASIEPSEAMPENDQGLDETSQKPKNKVSFHGVSIRQFARSLGDNPSAQDGPPLGLSWIYKDITRDENGASEGQNNDSLELEFPPTVIPIDDYEQQAARRRKKKLMEILKLQESTQKKIKANLRLEQRRASTQNIYFRDNDEALGIPKKKTESDYENTLSEEQMKQLSAKWLKIQPVSSKTRERIILTQTNCTKNEILARTKQLRRIQTQRKNTVAMSDTGLDEWQVAAGFIMRRYRRFKTGISKEKEQELLWEQAKDYWSLKQAEKESTVKTSTTSVASTSQMTSSITLSGSEHL